MDEYGADFWNQSYRDDPQGTVVRDFVLNEQLNSLRPGSALDLGCGTGENAIKLAKLGWKVRGIDFAESAIELAKQAAICEQFDVHFEAADFLKWKPAAQFDLVYSTYSLPEKAQRPEFIRCAVDALAPGGTLLIVEWDASMTEVWGFEPGFLASKSELVEELADLQIETAEVRHIENMFDQDDMRASASPSANILLIRARKPH